MASVVRRSSLSLACSLNHSNNKPSKPRKESILLLTNLEPEPKGMSKSTISPLESKSWRKLPKFQRRFYEWLVYSHNLPIAGEEDGRCGKFIHICC
ncbi:unnamed protein product [Rodentolepis nana]|uniref:PH domain-containing protein n=1 Tax=Rodentolepis nana TaxID=102285 RepID=A0A0R3TIS2_RODNA|nr:unnamed protein product [Rodentolepis nana]